MISQRTQPINLRSLGPLLPQVNLTPGGSQEARKGETELNTASKKVLETWFPARAALVTQRGGSGRQTSSRMLNLELRTWVADSGAAKSVLRCAIRQRSEEIAQILQQAREERWAALPRHAGSGRAPTARRLHISYHPVPPPPTPFVPTPVPPAQTSPMPRTPTAAALIQSLLGASPRSASCASPMEGVPERFGPVLQPKTPSFVYTPMEGVPERMGLPDMSIGKRWLKAYDAADAESPIEGVKGQHGRQDPGTGAQPSASQSSSFAFSRAGLTPGVHSCPEEPEAGRNARVHPLGFFAAEGARQLCHVEDVRTLDGAPKTPWRLKDYDPSPELLQRPKRQRYTIPSSLQPSAAQPEGGDAGADREDGAAELAPAQEDGREPAAELAQPEQDADMGHGDDYDDDDDFGGNNGGWGGDDNDSVADDSMAHDDTAKVSLAHDEEAGASKAPSGAVNQQPNSSSGAEQSQAQPEGSAKQLRSRRRPTSCNKRLRRDFQSRKSLAGEGLQLEGSLRRSTRRSVKPLDWWRNEKAVYERRFKSLPTVNDYTTVPSTPTWTFVTDYRKKQ